MPKEFTQSKIESMRVVSWAESEDVPPTQVRLIVQAADSEAALIIRFFGPETLDQLISALLSHREEVFGERGKN